MKQIRALKIILVLAIAGLLFSGYLSYMELFAPGGCTDALVSCGPVKINILNLPACVYGFFMYLIIFITTLCGLKAKEQK